MDFPDIAVVHAPTRRTRVLAYKHERRRGFETEADFGRALTSRMSG